ASLVAGRVFLDSDLNGVVGSAEVGIAGVGVAISGAGAGGADLQVVTDSQGAYRFIGLPEGVYTLWVGTPEGQLGGHIAVDEGFREVPLCGGGVVQDVDYGFYQGATLTGYVFRDDGAGSGGPGGGANDAERGSGEAGRPGVEVVAVHGSGVSSAI